MNVLVMFFKVQLVIYIMGAGCFFTVAAWIGIYSVLRIIVESLK